MVCVLDMQHNGQNLVVQQDYPNLIITVKTYKTSGNQKKGLFLNRKIGTGEY